MIKFISFIFLCTVISKSYSQEIYSSLFPPKTSNDGEQIWPFQNYQGQQRIGAKPCPKRKNLNDADQQWIPSYTSKVSHPLYPSPDLQPHALKNEDLKSESNIDHKLEQDFSKQNTPERRAFNVAVAKPSDLNAEDCDQPSSTNGASFAPDPEHLAMALVKDCLEKKHIQKQQALEQSAKPLIDSPIVYSRRSMSETDPDDSGYLANEEKNEDVIINNIESNTDANKTDIINADFNDNKVGRRNENTFVGSPIDNTRVCFACSTATNPLCWEPDQRTTIKYCTKEQSCVTKTFGLKNSLTVIRDCANTCEDSSVPGVEPKFKSCKLCHKDYCNGANSINGYIYNLGVVMVVTIIKCTFDF